jgi:hypothetical protein
VALGPPRPTAAQPAAHGDHHGDGSAAVVAAPSADEGTALATVGGLLVLALALGTLVAGLGRRQRRRFEALARERPDSPLSQH